MKRSYGVILLLAACGKTPTQHSGVEPPSGSAAKGDAKAELLESPETSAPAPTSTTTLEVPRTPFVSNSAFSGCVHPGVVRDCSDGWCRVPAGCFVMGSPTDELQHAKYAEDQARVTLTHDIEVQETELTLGDWRKAGWEDPNSDYGGGTANLELVSACTDAACPVNNATWYQALEYANWLSEQRGLSPCFRVYGCEQRLEGSGFGLACRTELLAPSVYECEGYRLPTSSEWEYVARAGTTEPFYSGSITSFERNDVCNDDPNLSAIAWYCANAGAPERAVGQLLPNQWGLHDVLGNVDEWTLDRERGVGTPDPSTDPEATHDPEGGAIVRGCQVNVRPALCRVAFPPGAPRDSREAGIRLVRTLGVGNLPTLDDDP